MSEEEKIKRICDWMGLDCDDKFLARVKRLKEASRVYEDELEHKKKILSSLIQKVTPRVYQDDPIIPKWKD